MTEELQIVDYRDRPRGAATRLEAWAKGKHLRMVRIVLLDGHGRVLLQKRGMTKRSYPGRWTDAATGHVNVDEDYLTAAHRELKEELGVDVGLTYIGKFHLSESSDNGSKKSFNAVFVGVLAPSSHLSLEEEAVDGVCWLPVDEVCRQASQDPEILTPGLVETASRFLAKSSLPTYVDATADRWGQS